MTGALDALSRPVEDDAPSPVFDAEARRFRATIHQSRLLLEIFDFLVACYRDGVKPKAADISRVISGGSDEYASRNPTVRVYVSRLRHKIDGFYEGAAGLRLHLPRGACYLRLVDAESVIGEGGGAPPAPPCDMASPRPAFPPPLPAPARTGRRRWLRWAAILLVCLDVAACLAILARQQIRASRSVLNTALWKPLVTGDRPVLLIVGDHYLFGETPDGMAVKRLVEEPAIASRGDLDAYLVGHPGRVGHLVDTGQHYLPAGVGAALGDLLPLFGGAVAGKVRVAAASDLTPDMLQGANIVYVGLTSGLGALRGPLLQQAGFAIGPRGALADRGTRRLYGGGWPEIAGGKAPAHSYGYLASFRMPSGEHVLLLTGTRDTAVRQMVEIATTRDQVDRLTRASSRPDAIEALYDVRAVGGYSIGARRLLVR